MMHLLFLVLPYLAFCEMGVDVSSLVSASSWKCMHDQHAIRFASVRAFMQTGHFDPNAAATVDHAHAAGLEVDVYFYPPFHRVPANASVEAFHKGVLQHHLKFRRVWIDIEEPAGWGHCAQNVAYMEDLYNSLRRFGYTVGVYSSASQWQPITCGFTGFKHLELWYPHYDNNPSFHDFHPFGGWTKPTIKQFRGSHTLCGAGVDANWRP